MGRGRRDELVRAHHRRGRRVGGQCDELRCRRVAYLERSLGAARRRVGNQYLRTRYGSVHLIGGVYLRRQGWLRWSDGVGYSERIGVILDGTSLKALCRRTAVKRYLTASFGLVVLAVLTACGGSSMQNSFVPGQSQPPMVAQGMLSQMDLMLMEAPRYRACPEETRPGYMTCYAILSRFAMDRPMATSCLHKPGCYGPVELQGAYGMTAAAKTKGKGVTVAVVDAYGYTGGYKAMAKDLNAYRS